MLQYKVPIKWVEKRIMTADSSEMDVVLQAVMSWQKQRFPEHELIIWSLPVRNTEERKQQINIMTRCLAQWDGDVKR